MRICAVMKYPPIQGGVSAQCYWMARGLAEVGHEVYVVSNAEDVEAEYRIELTAEDRTWLEPRFDHGGKVRLHPWEPFSRKFSHIPQANPFVSRLAGLATWVVRRYDCDLIFSYYMEPNGMAASVASAWTGVPYVVHHAGSDLGRLMNIDGLDTAYREVFRRADGVCAGSSVSFLGMGVAPEAIYRNPGFNLPTGYFNPQVEPLDLQQHIGEIREAGEGAFLDVGTFDPSLPTIGIYGKMGTAKGSFDLLRALGQLRAEGRRFNFMALTRGHRMETYLEAVEENGLAEVAWVLPFVPHWKVARFVRACQAVCFLERDFPIKFHTPTIPTEVLACGTCLILSGEIQAKQFFSDQMVDGENYLLVPDPKVHDDLSAALRRVLDDPAWAAEVGLRGAELIDRTGNEQNIGDYETIFVDVLRRRRGEPSQVSFEDRGLPASRDEALTKMLPVLTEALADRADAHVAAYLAAHPAAPADVFDDLLAFARFVYDRAVQEEDIALRDAAHYSELIAWQSHVSDEEVHGLVFDSIDESTPLIGTRWQPEVLQALAPLRSNWVRLEQFETLPPIWGAQNGNTNGHGHIFVFHKRPNMNGHHFKVNPWTADLLRRCDGSTTVGELVRQYHEQTGRPMRALGQAVIAALRRFHREGLIVFTRPEPVA